MYIDLWHTSGGDVFVLTIQEITTPHSSGLTCTILVGKPSSIQSSVFAGTGALVIISLYWHQHTIALTLSKMNLYKLTFIHKTFIYPLFVVDVNGHEKLWSTKVVWCLKLFVLLIFVFFSFSGGGGVSLDLESKWDL